jgi:hypothetical protein
MIEQQADGRSTFHQMGHDMILLLYGLTRSVQLYEVNNATITKQIDLLVERLERGFVEWPDGIRIQLMADEFFLNGKLLRADPKFWDRAVALAAFFQQFELGELHFGPGTTKAHCQAFIRDLGASVRAQRNQLGDDGYGPLQIGEAQGQSTASFDLRPDRFAILLCGSLLDVMEWFYQRRDKPGLSLLPQRIRQGRRDLPGRGCGARSPAPPELEPPQAGHDHRRHLFRALPHPAAAGDHVPGRRRGALRRLRQR